MKENKSGNQSFSIKQVLKLVQPFRRIVVLFFTTLIISSFFESFGLAMLFPLFEMIIEGETRHQLSKALIYPLKLVGFETEIINVSLFLLLIVFIKSIFRLLNTYYSNKICFDVRRSIMEKISRYYLSAPFSDIISEKQGVLINDLVHEPHKATGGMMKITEFLISFVMIFFYYSVLLLTDIKITLIVTFASIVLYIIFTRLSKNILQKYGEDEIVYNQEINAIGAESISALRQIKTFGIKELIIKKLRKNILGLTNVGIKYVVFQAIPRITIELILFTGIVSVIIVLNNRSFDLLVSVVPVLTVFVVVSQKLFSSLSKLISTKTSLHYYFPSINLILSILDKKKSDDPIVSRKSLKFTHLESDIYFKNITFSYNGKEPIYENATFSIPNGKITAIVGESGVGKSTIADLILGLYRPQKGTILINGKPLYESGTENWRKKIGFVSQDNFLFHTTIMENIRFGNLEASNQMIINAAKSANAHDFILGFPDDYETVVGDRGMLISGGQKQRIAIARALVRNPELLIFDEATSALDYKTEIQLQEEIFKVSKGKTVLIISHRLETVKKADKIMKIENGRITEIQYENILAMNDNYKK